ncbi:uncharacterized LOC100502232 [Zea mays]|uniref:Uncharacterized protein n=1 Tax=Zea mays TaxID=4577 RepID=C4J9J1_MAIZE|nr:uncharacterized LOC100502232 [Zea mays]ACR37841.1 unknown [Zea mays]|eukprot:NP_001183638.1 uncharacterized protein LOC100502232 [Zea mays]
MRHALSSLPRHLKHPHVMLWWNGTACAGDPGAAPRGRGEQHGVRGQRARQGPGVRLRGRRLVAAAAGGGAAGAAGAGAGRGGPPQDEQRLRPAPPQGGRRRRRRRRGQQQQLRRLAVVHVLAQDRGGGGAGRALQGHYAGAAGAGHGRGPARHGRRPLLVLLANRAFHSS